MQFTINRDTLLSNLNNVGKALSSKTPMPILTGVKIDVKSEYLTLTASNGEVSIQTKIETGINLRIEKEGTCVLPGKFLIDIVRKVVSKNIDITLSEETTVKILAEKSNFSLNVLDGSVYPDINFEEIGSCITLDSTNFKQLIRKTTFAASVSENRVILTGLYFVTNGNKMEAIATDSYRMAKKYMIFDHEYPTLSAVIPSKSLDELNRIIEDNEEIVEMYFAKTKVLFKYKNVLYLTRLLDGTFPNTTSLVPVNFLLSIKFNKQELTNAIDRAALFTTNETSNIIKMTIKGNESVEIASTTNQIGTVLEELTPIECSKNMAFRIAFSSKYFLDAIKVFDSSEITLHFTGEIKPFIITGDDDINMIQLILPVRSS